MSRFVPEMIWKDSSWNVFFLSVHFSQNGLGWKGTLKLILFQCAAMGRDAPHSLGQVAQGPVQPGPGVLGQYRCVRLTWLCSLACVNQLMGQEAETRLTPVAGRGSCPSVCVTDCPWFTQPSKGPWILSVWG